MIKNKILSIIFLLTLSLFNTNKTQAMYLDELCSMQDIYNLIINKLSREISCNIKQNLKNDIRDFCYYYFSIEDFQNTNYENLKKIRYNEDIENFIYGIVNNYLNFLDSTPNKYSDFRDFSNSFEDDLSDDTDDGSDEVSQYTPRCYSPSLRHFNISPKNFCRKASINRSTRKHKGRNW